MDIEEFYDADPRRRPSKEIELGTRWHDHHGTGYELNWIEDTGELYVMKEPSPHLFEGPFGWLHPSMRAAQTQQMSAHVVAQIATVEELHQILQGWPDVEDNDDSAEWLAERLRAAGVAISPEPPIEDDAVDPDPLEG